jgi:phosphoribosylamine--glycine ligase
VRVLIIGGGGREHALAWKCAQAAQVDQVLVAPGNGGTALEAKCRNLDVAADDIDSLVQAAIDNQVHVTIVGPEQPLVAGIVDRFEAAGLRCFGPTAAAARLEGSKAFAKEFLIRYQIPTARYQHFDQVPPALDYLADHPLPVVVKADGLAAGKGVVIAETLAAAEAAVRDMLEQNRFGAAGAAIVIEEFLSGEEVSFIAVVDGDVIVPLATSQDHKARDEGDRGPNTGGMGAYSPAPIVSDELHDRIMAEVMIPTVKGLAAEGARYRGFLYAGLMIDAAGNPSVLEFNCRFGDPETQPILFRMQSDLVALCDAAIDGQLASFGDVQWDPRPTLGVVIAAEGYPGNYAKGKVISGLEADARSPDWKIFHAGTQLVNDKIVTSGGRVLCAVARGDDIRAAQQSAYELTDSIHWDGVFSRRDIGYRAVARL